MSAAHVQSKGLKNGKRGRGRREYLPFDTRKAENVEPDEEEHELSVGEKVESNVVLLRTKRGHLEV